MALLDKAIMSSYRLSTVNMSLICSGMAVILYAKLTPGTIMYVR